MKQFLHAFLFLALISFLFSACLTVEGREYRIRLKSDRSGEATIRFLNIMSESDDTVDISHQDFQELIASYLEGGSPEKDFAGIQNVRKRLFEENGTLVGEIAFTFDSLAAVRLFRYDDESPFMYFAGNPLSSEQLVETDGTFGREWMPVVFWPAGTKEFYIKTRTQSEVSYRKPLLNHYRTWLAETEKTKKRQ